MAVNGTVMTLEAVEKSFQGLHVLKGVTFSVKKGEIFALLGSNGAGKTTLVKILSTLMNPDAGHAAVCGLDVVKQSEKVREHISLTGQYAAVDDELTGRENLRLMAALRHLKHGNASADALLEQFGLQDAASRRVGTYSGGMRRRLDIAMGLLGEPTVIFLDEPTTGLDPQSRFAMWEIMRRLAQSGKTIFLTTQYLEEAEQLADTIAVLHEGRIVAEGTPAQLKNRLPQGVIELKVHSEADLSAMRRLLQGYQVTETVPMLSLTLITDGSTQQLMDVFRRINESGILVRSFSQKLPTLEDAFCVLIGETKRGA